MRIDWQLGDAYEEIGGAGLLHEAIEDALNTVPREHLRRLDTLLIRDTDPKGKSLGIWRQDHGGCAIEMYAEPHVSPLLLFPAQTRDFALRLHLAYTLFHEVGHHVTRVLNPRATPPRKAALVEAKIERWADDYAEKRLRRLCASWLAPGGLAADPEARRALSIALRALRLEKITEKITETEAGTKTALSSS